MLVTVSTVCPPAPRSFMAGRPPLRPADTRDRDLCALLCCPLEMGSDHGVLVVPAALTLPEEKRASATFIHERKKHDDCDDTN